MNIKVIRKYRGPSYTIDTILIDDVYFCDGLEDPDRNLTDSMSVDEILSKKIKGNTCIPYGKYEVTLTVTSSKYSNYSKYKYATIAKGKIPRILNVKGFEGILIHAGNTADHTEGCLLVGENKVKGKVINSQATWVKLYELLSKADKAGEPITIEFTK